MSRFAIKTALFFSTVTNGKLKEGNEAGKMKERTNKLFLLKNHDIFTTLMSYARIAAMSRVGILTQRSETETRLSGRD